MKRCILVVDDDDVSRRMTVSALSCSAGWDVLEAYCGAQGTECAIEKQPDAILLDVMMPGMDGPAMLNKLKTARMTAHIPVVLLTAKKHSPGGSSLLRLPVEGVLSKPYDPLRLAEQVAEALGWKRCRFDPHSN